MAEELQELIEHGSLEEALNRLHDLTSTADPVVPEWLTRKLSDIFEAAIRLANISVALRVLARICDADLRRSFQMLFLERFWDSILEVAAVCEFEEPMLFV